MDSKDKMTYEQEIQKVLEELAILQQKAQKLVNHFYVEHEKADIYSIINLMYERGNPKNRAFLDDFKRKYDEGELSLLEIEKYNDLYDQHKTILV